MVNPLDLPVGAQAEVIAKLARKGWVTIPQLARLAGLTPQTVRKHQKAGRLEAILVGAQLRIYEDEIIRYLTQNKYVGAHTFDALAKELHHDNE
jgi:excisionase family DNA binding protein